MFRELLALWIIFQLLMIGYTIGNLEVDCHNQTGRYSTGYKSEFNTGNAQLGGILFPIAIFIPEDNLKCD